MKIYFIKICLHKSYNHNFIQQNTILGCLNDSSFMQKYTAYEQFKLCNSMINLYSIYIFTDLFCIDVILKNKI